MATSETSRLTDLVGQLRELYRPSTDVQDHPYEVQDILEEVHSPADASPEQFQCKMDIH